MSFNDENDLEDILQLFERFAVIEGWIQTDEDFIDRVTFYTGLVYI